MDLITYFDSPGASWNPKRSHHKVRKEREVLAEGGAEKHKAIEEYGILKTEPQMNADERGLIALLSEK